MSVGYIPSPPVLLSKLSSPPLAPYLCSASPHTGAHTPLATFPFPHRPPTSPLWHHPSAPAFLRKPLWHAK